MVIIAIAVWDARDRDGTARPVAVAVATPAQATPPSPDREALVAFYHATGGPGWARATNWLSGRPVGEWHGVATDRDGRVTHLTLPGEGLRGEIPPALGSLHALLVLDLGGNALTGHIPSELGRLTRLQRLALGANLLTGPLPPELGRLQALVLLALPSNHLYGPIPPELGSLTQLVTIRLQGNDFSGCIPAAWRAAPLNDFEEVGLPFCD